LAHGPPRTFYKDATKYGFYELQSARDWYREVTADIGMHADLVRYWISVAALLASPVAPHFAEHIWRGILHHPTSIQRALWPTPPRSVDAPTIDAGAYMRTLVKAVRDAELTLLKKLGKGKGGGAPAFDPKKPRSVRVYVATRFPEWQDACVQAVQAAWVPEPVADAKSGAGTGRVDDAKVRALLTERGLIKDKRAMPFVQLFKVRPFFLVFFFFFIVLMMWDILETDCGVWGRHRVQAEAAVRRDGRAARGAALLEAHVDPRRCGGPVRGRGADARRGGPGGIQPHDHREL
jgi:leucyl-tRNA synthetase